MQDHFKEQTPPTFSKIRNFLWPIYNNELSKLIPMFILFFLISFVYNILRNMKIALIVTAEYSGAEVIPFLKIGAVLPGALFFTYLFTKLIDRFNREQVFYTILSGFLLYFAIFLFILFPNHKTLQLDYMANILQSIPFFGDGLSGFVALIRHLNLTIFYVLAEMWSSLVLSILFWGFANEVTKVHEAKRFYAIFALGSNSSSLFTAMFARFVKNLPYCKYLPFDQRSQWVFYQLSCVLLIGTIIIIIFYWINRSVFHVEKLETLKIPKKTKQVALKECFKYLGRSRYLTCIVILVATYNIVYNLADVMWTYKIKQVFTDSLNLNDYINQVASVTGLLAILFAFLISGNLIRKYGWTLTAVLTPLVWLLTSLGFFSGLIFEGPNLVLVMSSLISNPANFVLLLGSIQICLGRACKYTLFDETKEIAFIPLSKENQRRGKAVVDGLASRLGKSGGSAIYILLFMLCGTIERAVPYVLGVIVIVVAFWILAVFTLGRMVKSSIDKR